MRRRIERKSSFGCNGFNQVCKDQGNVKNGRKKNIKEKEKILFLMYLVVREMKIAVGINSIGKSGRDW